MTKPYQITINDQTIVAPGDYILVRADVFEEIAKAFSYIERCIDEFDPDPQNFDHHGLIFARKEARQDASAVRAYPDTQKTTGIWTAKKLVLDEEPTVWTGGRYF